MLTTRSALPSRAFCAGTTRIDAFLYADFLRRLLKVLADESAAGQRRQIYGGSSPTKAFSIGPGGLLLDANGNPLLDKDGYPMMSDPWLRPEGVVLDENRNLLYGADRSLLLIDPSVEPGGIINSIHGREVLGTNGMPLHSDPRHAKGCIVLHADGRPVLGIDGKPFVVPHPGVAIPAGGAIGPGGVILGVDGKPVIGIDGTPMVIDPRIPPGGRVGPGGVLIDANGNRMLGEDGKPLIIAMEGGLKPLDAVRYIDVEKEMAEQDVKDAAQAARDKVARREARQRAGLPKIPVQPRNRALQPSRQHMSPHQTSTWSGVVAGAASSSSGVSGSSSARTTRTPDGSFQPWRTASVPPSWTARQSEVAWGQVFRRPATTPSPAMLSSTVRLHCLPDLTLPSRPPPSPHAFATTSSRWMKSGRVVSERALTERVRDLCATWPPSGRT